MSTCLRSRYACASPDVAPAPETAGHMPKPPSGAPDHHHYTDSYYRGRKTAASRAINSGFIPRAPTYTVLPGLQTAPAGRSYQKKRFSPVWNWMM